LDHRGNPLAPLLVRQPGDGAVSHRGVCHHLLLDLQPGAAPGLVLSAFLDRGDTADAAAIAVATRLLLIAAVLRGVAGGAAADETAVDLERGRRATHGCAERPTPGALLELIVVFM
jgi:hypothetical protein